VLGETKGEKIEMRK